MHAVKTPGVNVHFFGETREMVKDNGVNAMDKRENNTLAHYAIKDKQLKTLLLRPMSKINLLDRLRHVYTHKKGKHKGNRSKKRKN